MAKNADPGIRLFMKKFLLISSEFPPGPGGIGRHAADLAFGLIHHGCTVRVLSVVDRATPAEIDAFQTGLPKGMTLEVFPRIGWRTMPKRVQMIFRELHENPPDEVIVTGKFPIWMGGWIKFYFGKRFPVHGFIHGSEVRLPVGWQRSWFDDSLRRLDSIWAVSRFTRDLMPPKLAQDPKVHLLANGIIVEDWDQVRSETNKKDLKGEPNLITVGNVSPRKGQHRIIQALPELVKTYPNLHYHIVGLPSHKEPFQALADSLGVADHITFHGKAADRQELADFYAGSDVFLMLSENQVDGDVEGFGIAILEANFMGLPAIGALGCGIEDAIENGVNGYLVDGNDHPAILNALNTILQNYDSLSKTSQEFARRHDWKVLSREFLGELIKV